jgi:FkbH-like protein
MGIFMLPSQSSKFMPTYVSYQHPEMMDIAIAANFTAEPIEDSLRFWAQFLEQNCVFSFAPYNQIFQQLLNTNSKFFVKNKGLNVLLIRLQEWSGEVNRNVDDLINALIEATNHTTRPFLLCFCPATPIAQKDFQTIETSVAAQLANHVGIHVVTSVELNTYYPVRDFYDATGDKLGKIPYTQLFFVALGTRIMRIQHRLQIKPYKVIVLDCDNTLWQGICGEDGALGICISPEYTQLQNFMLNCHQQGMLLCLCSKNNEADVKQVFDCHPDMLLQWQHIVDYRINWQAKSVNIQSLAETLNLGLDSFIFIDDSPMECAEVERHLPQVLSLQLPKNSQDFARFLQHIWAFDSLNITEEDRRRTTFYQANVQRENLRNSTLTLKNFIDELELNVVINFITIEQLPRIAQLTQRTNQFNTTSLRFSEQDLVNYLQQYNHYCLTVEVDDRFGHYGLVGVVLYHVDDKKLYVENLLLSCRVLGRMVEHRLLTYLGNIAQQNQLDYVEISYLATARNGLVLDFLRNLVKQNTVEIDDGYLFTFTVLQCIQITEITESEKPVTQSKIN